MADTTVSQYTTRSHWLSKEKVWHISRKCVVQFIVPPAGWISRTVKQSKFLLITDITSLSIFVGFFVIADRRYFQRKRRRFLPWSICSKFRFFKWTMTDAAIKRKPIYVYYLLLADSIKPRPGTCKKEVNYRWFSCVSWYPKGAHHVR